MNSTWEGPSKSARKRAMHALQALGAALLEVSERQWHELLGEYPDLIEELRIAKAMDASSAKQRQLRHLGKLLEQTDHAAIEDQLARLNKPAQEDKALLHAAEAARAALLDGDTLTLNEFCQQHPQACPTTLTSLLNAARREHAAGAPPKSARLLFRYLRDLLKAPRPPN
jgi:ribosome-associated protein